MDIQIDTREKSKAIQRIIKTFKENNVNYCSSKLFVGDYMNMDNPRLIVDRKQNLSEVYSNLCQGHKRFTNEILRAKEFSINLIILVEHGGKIKTLDDVKEWHNPQLDKSPYAWNGERLYKTISTIQKKYGVDFVFCDKSHTGKKIMELLG